MSLKTINLILLILFLAENAIGDDHIARSQEMLPAEHQNCHQDQDCVRVSLKCSCDCGVIINKSFLSHYLEIKESECQNYSGPYCKMACPEEVKCSNGKCIVMKIGS